METKKGIMFCLIGTLLISGCQTQAPEDSTTEQTTETISVLLSESSNEEVEPIIFTGLDIVDLKESNTTLDNGLLTILNDLKKRKEYIDATEYLFYIETVAQDESYNVLIKANYSDIQKEIAQYHINFESVERVEIKESEEN